ncbi:endothelin-converting enzyme 2 [Fusarium heterosporum]|uniref:Endothelin-converting enzyme 2 n=1 Tax=Fusarium heterosporum TaxID=42747 RepID=A0A8H5WFW4_FUSHE|nr:endothelin-converting enzyme 2 [Fusarium heterosporum]
MAPTLSTTGFCTSTACLQLAAEMKQSMALNYTEIDPCQDFEQYACGNWDSYHDIPEGAESIYGLTLAEQFTNSAVRKILENPYPVGEDAGYISVNLTKEQIKADKRNHAKMQDAYQVCMNYTALEEEGLQGLSEVVNDIVDMFPVAKPNTTLGTSSSSLTDTLAYFENFGIGTFQSFVIDQNEYDPEEVIAVLYPPVVQELALPETDQDTAELVQLSARLLKAVYPSKIDTATAAGLAKSIYTFQSQLIDAWVWSQLNEPADIAPAGDLKKQAPRIDYDGVVKQLAPKSWKGRINTMQPLYFKNVSDIVAETTTETLQAYFVWRMVSSVSPYVEHSLTNTYNDMLSKLKDKDPEDVRPRWRNCAILIDQGVDWIVDKKIGSAIGPHGLTWILSRFFVDKNFGPEKVKLASQLVDYIKESFSERIKTRDWATSKVKKAALEKLNAIQKTIGLPTDPNPMDPIEIEEYYSDIEIKPSLVMNALAFAKSGVSKRWDTLAKPYSRGQLIKSTLEANAYYSPTRNEIGLLAGYLQAPLFDVEYPDYINYGGAGVVVGHEITHGFDTQGYQYDKSGNKTSWWDKESEEAFINKTKCFIDQYSNFTIKAANGTDLHVNGTLTVSENIADAGGVVSGFAAWKKREYRKGKAKNLPGMEKFTHEQLFFLKWGQTWCSSIKPARSLRLLSSDVHAPSSARALLPLRNSAGFNKAFNCPKREPACELW